ncbi:hypothetical protein [Streptomyces sp. NPDC023838]
MVRDTAFYSILDEEWPQVRERLEERVGVRPTATGMRSLVPA